MNAPQTAALLWPPLLPLLALLLGPQASLGGGRCYTRLPPPPEYCKPHTTCATDNSTCPGCGAKFPPGCPCPPSKEPFVPPPLPLRNFLSRTLGSNMVLQRAPQQAAVWGFAKAGTTVTTTMDALAPMLTKADSEGVWRQRLPATAGSTTTAHTITITGSGGEHAKMTNVLFGDVYLCGGQSNMQMPLAYAENGTAEIMRGDGYPHIRLFTATPANCSTVPFEDLQPASVGMKNLSIGAAGWSYGSGALNQSFSGVCWLFGRDLFDKLDGEVPIGLIGDSCGGTPIEHWSTPTALGNCSDSRWGPSPPPPGISCTPGQTRCPDSILYNALIHPYTVGPMSLTGFIWYQGESQLGVGGAVDSYACTFPKMITEWRRLFKNPTAYFGFVLLGCWCGGGASGDAEAAMRAYGQMAAAKLQKVGWAANQDHCDGCNIHPPAKQFCASRLATSALALQYGRPILWRSPTFKSQVAAESPPSMTITLNDVSAAGLTTDHFPNNYCLRTHDAATGMCNDRNWSTSFNCAPFSKDANETHGSMCAWGSLSFNVSSCLPCQRPDPKSHKCPPCQRLSVNATITVKDKNTLVFTPQGPLPRTATGAPVSSSYGWGAVPMFTVYDKQTKLPLLGWQEPRQH